MFDFIAGGVMAWVRLFVGLFFLSLIFMVFALIVQAISFVAGG